MKSNAMALNIFSNAHPGNNTKCRYCQSDDHKNFILEITKYSLYLKPGDLKNSRLNSWLLALRTLSGLLESFSVLEFISAAQAVAWCYFNLFFMVSDAFFNWWQVWVCFFFSDPQGLWKISCSHGLSFQAADDLFSDCQLFVRFHSKTYQQGQDVYFVLDVFLQFNPRTPFRWHWKVDPVVIQAPIQPPMR